MKILFMGTPEFAAVCLNKLHDAGHEILAVFTQPDKPKNRGMKQQAPPVKEYALAHGIAVFQPEKLRDGTALELVKRLDPEVIVVAAYGRILPKEILDYPPHGCINVHSSLLPNYRGAAPIHWAILNGDEVTGITIMHMAEELDAGDCILQAETPIDPDETVESLHDRLALLGGTLLLDALTRIEAGTAPRIPQNPAQVSFAPMLSRALSPMDWTRSAKALHDQVRGLVPWPGATVELGGIRCKVWKTRLPKQQTEKAPGTVLQAGREGIFVACGDGGVLQILELQAEGKRRMSASDYLHGNPVI